MANDNPHDLWLHWTRTQRKSREDLITCRADRRAVMHMRLPSTPSDALPAVDPCSFTFDYSSGRNSTDACVGDVSEAVHSHRIHRNDASQPRDSAFTPVSCDSRKPSSQQSDYASFWTKQKQRIMKERKRLDVWNVHDSICGSAAHSSDGTGTASTGSFPHSAKHADASVAPTFNSNDTVDSLRDMADLSISTSIVIQQEEIWNRIKNPVTALDAKPSPVSRQLDLAITKSPSQKEVEKKKSTIGSKLKLYGKRVRIIPQSQVREAWKRGEAVEISCVVCHMRLLTIADMYPGMVYCPECCVIAPFDVYGASK